MYFIAQSKQYKSKRSSIGSNSNTRPGSMCSSKKTSMKYKIEEILQSGLKTYINKFNDITKSARLDQNVSNFVA